MPDVALGEHLCDGCKTVLPMIRGRDDTRGHENPAWFRLSVKQGCAICTRLASRHGSVSKFGKLIFDYYHDLDVGCGIEVLYWRRGWGGVGVHDYRLRRGSAADLLFKTAQASRNARNTGHDSVAKLALQWMRECVSEHPRCHSNSRPDWYPSRLLYLNEKNVRLVSRDEVVSLQPYATLSHCWGEEDFCVLTLDNITQFQTGQPLIAFPLTFQHIIITARRLGLQYLWIDCFCIVQDREADKRHEIAEMEQVYANAIINFGATNASKHSDGCSLNESQSQMFVHLYTEGKTTASTTLHINPVHLMRNFRPPC